MLETDKLLNFLIQPVQFLQVVGRSQLDAAHALAGVANGVVGANELGHTVITATTAEGYTASCDVYVTGTALRVYYKGAPLQYGANLDLYYTHELSLVEDHYYDNGFSVISQKLLKPFN